MKSGVGGSGSCVDVQNGAVVDTDESLRKWMVNTAEQHGAAVMHVAGDDSGPAYAFSVGAWRRFGKPEVVVIGLPQEVAHSVVNTYVQRAGQGERFQPGQRVAQQLQAEIRGHAARLVRQHAQRRIVGGVGKAAQELRQ